MDPKSDTPSDAGGQPDDAMIDDAFRQVDQARKAAEQAAVRRQAALPPDGSFTGYKLIKELHRGGQGVVYKAIQTSMDREVALKVVKEGPFARESEKIRFEREVQILSALRHPNIVTIYDSGSSTGQYFFAMDYIEGQPLDVYLASRDCSVEETLRLFITICNALHAAHICGVVHRDIKPGNILVDAQDVPHVLDFGLAKDVVARSTSDAPNSITEEGQFIGSLPWASPEHARSTKMIDARSDVYSLGVLFYQLLTRRFPYPVTGAVRDVLNNITDVAPARPGSFAKSVNDEIETILLTCLAKEPERRYQNAGDLADDFQRYLNGEPIKAKRDSTLYVLKKNLRRHRVVAVLAALLTITSLAFGLFMFRVAGTESALRQRAVKETQRVKRATEAFKRLVFAAGPAQLPASEYSAAAFLRLGSQRALAGLGEHPDIEVEVRLAIGETFNNLSEFDQAEEHFREAVRLSRSIWGESDPRVADAQDGLARVLHARGQYGESQELAETALGTRRSALPQDDLDLTESLNTKAESLRMSGRAAEAIPVYKEAVAILRDHSPARDAELATVLNNLALAHHNIGDFETVERLLYESVEIKERVLGKKHPSYLRGLANLGQFFSSRFLFDKAEPLLLRALELRRTVLTEEDPELAVSLNQLGVFYTHKGDLSKAQSFFEEALSIRRKSLDPHHLDIAESLNNMAKILVKTGRLAQANDLTQEAIAIHRNEAHSPMHPQLGVLLNTLAGIRQELGSEEPIEPLYGESLMILRKTFGKRPHFHLATSQRNLAYFYTLQGDYSKAQELFTEALRMIQQLPPGQRKLLADTRSKFGECLAGLNRQEEAEQALLRGLEEVQESFGESGKQSADAINRLISYYEGRGEEDRAGLYRSRLPESGERAEGEPMPD